jgi:hypothetical protein
MRFILPDNLQFVKRFIEKTFFGALKVHDVAIQDRFLVETVFIDANQYLWCCCAEELPVETSKFPVSLKYIDKVKGIYMKVTGIANRMIPGHETGAGGDALMLKPGLTLLRVKMTETVYYKKHKGQINFYAVAS